ncbi:MAG: transcriptional regulator [Burkholderiales bacterium]|nr:transcriptional regulator [Burkholderiales bacterium]
MRADWAAPQPGLLPYTYANFARAKVFLFGKWCEVAADRHQAQPADLSGACKYGSLFMQGVFGGELRGHYEHQYNFIAGRLVDLSHDAADVGRMRQPYRHEPEYFAVPELQAALERCLLRTDAWAAEFVGLRN